MSKYDKSDPNILDETQKEYCSKIIEHQIRIRGEIKSGGPSSGIVMIESVKEKPKIRKHFENYALEASILEQIYPEDFIYILNKSKGKRNSRMFVFGDGITQFVMSSRFRLLKKLFEVIIIWPKIPVARPNPVPVPNPPEPIPEPTPNPDDFNLIPSNIPGECHPTLVIVPDGYCKVIEGSIDDYLPEIRTRHAQDPRRYYYWLPLQTDSQLPSDEDFVYAWSIEDCFCKILLRGIECASECLRRNSGEMNYNIIVQVSQKTVDTGFLKHKCFLSFEQKIARMDKYWEHVYGVNLTIQIV